MAYTIPLFDVNFDEKEAQAAYDTIKSKWVSAGAKCEELEKTFCELWNVKHALAVSNCTVALHMACILAGFKQGDEVLCPSLTFAASANCIRYVGAKPVFCDLVGLDDMTISPADIEKKITNKTKGIVVVHFAGFPCDMDAIMAIAKKHNLKVIEDACHGPLSEYKGKKLGTIGDFGCFSFFSNKNISTGEGGMLITNNDEYAERGRLIRSHGMTTMSFQRASGHATSYDIVDLGYNFRFDDIRASIALEQLKKLPADYKRRAEIRERFLKNLSACVKVVIPFKNNTEYVSNYILPVILKESNREYRDSIRQKLADKGIQTSVHYPAIHLFTVFKEKDVSLPVTEYITDNEITLPMYAKLSDEQVDFICETLKEELNNKITTIQNIRQGGVRKLYNIRIISCNFSDNCNAA